MPDFPCKSVVSHQTLVPLCNPYYNILLHTPCASTVASRLRSWLCPALQDALSPRTSVFLSDVETDSWPPDTVQRLAAQSDRWLVTRGEFGAHEFTVDEGMSLVEPLKVCCCT